MKIIHKAEDFEVHHKIVSFVAILFLTIVITRAVIQIKDPDIILRGFELHHFYLGLVLLVITNLLLLYRRVHFKLALALSGVSIGLIVDELIFIGQKVRGTIAYNSTLLPTILAAIVVVLVVEFIFYFRSKSKIK